MSYSNPLIHEYAQQLSNQATVHPTCQTSDFGPGIHLLHFTNTAVTHQFTGLNLRLSVRSNKVNT